MPIASFRTFATGPRQLVVQDAFEMMRSARVVDLVEVDPERDRHVRVLRGGGDDHPFGTGFEVLGGTVAVGEEPGRLDHDAHTELTPRQLCRIALGEHLERLAVEVDLVADRLDVAGKRPKHRVVLEQVGERVGVGDVVDGHEVDIELPLPGRPEEVPADATEAVDADLDGHADLPPGLRFQVPASRLPAGLESISSRRWSRRPTGSASGPPSRVGSRSSGR